MSISLSMKQSIILGIGTGRCGTASLAKVLNQQEEAVGSFEEPPLLPWGINTLPPRCSPPVQGRLSESVRRLCSLSDAELAAYDVAELNLLVVGGLPGAEDLDMGACLERLDAWAELVRINTAHWWADFKRSPEQYDNAAAKFRMLCLVTVLQRHLGARYYLPFSEGEYDGTDSRNLFVHGPLSGQGGTCNNMGVLYAAVGRRLGYPLKLVHAKEHYLLRWEEPDGERFNIEATSEGFCPHDDAYYHRWPKPLSAEELAGGVYLRSMTPREELAEFLCLRGICLTEHLRTYPALEAFYFADQLAPQSPTIRSAWAPATMLWSMIECCCQALSCAHADIVAAMKLLAYKNELAYDALPFPTPQGATDRWAVCRARHFLQRILANDVRKRRQADARCYAFAAIGAAKGGRLLPPDSFRRKGPLACMTRP